MKSSIAQRAQSAIAEAFEALGGTEGLTEWARKNPDKFYLFLWPRLIPKEIKAEVDVKDQLAQLQPVQVVQVANMNEALNELERSRDEHLAHRRSGRENNQLQLAERFPAHAGSLPESDEG